MNNSYVPFLSDEDFREIVRNVITESMKKGAKHNIFKNSVDPFSALFDAFTRQITVSDWIDDEQLRQKQKTLQNRIGRFHEDLLGAIAGCTRIDQVVDIECPSRQLVAEVKNKFNTVKGSDKKGVYDSLAQALGERGEGYVGYYVEIIPKNGSRYDMPFTPSDNLSKVNRPRNERIRVIDGYSFYALLTGVEPALQMVYRSLPRVISAVTEVSNEKVEQVLKDPYFDELFVRAYGDQS